MKTEKEILYTYHPIKHDTILCTDLWPTSTVLMAMKEFASQTLEGLSRETGEKMLEWLKVRVAGYKEHLRSLQSDQLTQIAVHKAVVSELETIIITQFSSAERELKKGGEG